MVALTRFHVPSLVLVGIGIAVIASGVTTYPHAGQPAYQHHVERVDASTVPADERVYDVEALSESAQAAVEQAIESPDGSVSVYGAASRPPEFEHGDAPPQYFLGHEGDLYRLETSGGPPGLARLLLLASFVAAGGVAVAVGVLSVRVPRPRLAPALAVACAILLAVVQFDLYPRWDDTQLEVGGTLLLAALPAVVTWLMLDRVVYAGG